jgi:hypothetical protein
VRRALAAVDHVEVREGELELAGELLDALAHLALGHGGELVKERLDWASARTGQDSSLKMG